MIGSHRDNAHFSRSGWRKRIMLPCWIVQILILLSLMGLFSYRLSSTVTTWEEAEGKGEVPVVELVWETANIAFSLISLIVTLVSIARFIAEVLTPLPLLFGCILNVVLASAVLALDIVIYVQHKDKNYSIIGLALDTSLILFTAIPLIYAIIIYRRLLSYDDYHLPGNHKAYGFTAVEEGVGVGEERRTSTTHLSPPTPYDPTSLALGTTTTVTGGSGEPRTRDRSVSIGSRRISLNFTRPTSMSPQTQAQVSPPLLDERRVSYDHKRDTQFEAYAAKRASQRMSRHSSASGSASGSGSGSYRDDVSLRDDVSRALGDEFGFSDLPSPPAEPGRVVNNNNNNNGRGGGEVVSAGAVRAAHGVSRPRVSSIGMARQTSYEVVVSKSGGGETGGANANANVNVNGVTFTVTTPPDEALRRGHSLNLGYIPEEEDHHHYQHHYPPGQGPEVFIANANAKATGRAGLGRRRAASESQQALLADDGASAMERAGANASAGLEDVELEERR
ncbi:hypothetical protein F5Y14DRAFT_328366 [Nemania sp. NC0429]|nr:hypothetical protein F5Y14DRAFT_328366 [Nemania sp. NC0429]